jgi:hypothetical protein
MTPEQQTPASVVETELSNNPCQFDRDQPVSNHYKLAEASKAFLTEAARYFEARPTGGEDAAHWSNVFNAKNCREAAALIERLSAEREGLNDLLKRTPAIEALTPANWEWDACEVVQDRYDLMKRKVDAAFAALTQGGSRGTGWVEWNGGENPVPGEVVEARFTGGFVSEALDSESFGWDRHNDPVIAPMYDIVAYRIVPLPAAPTPADGSGE